jgi:hypothetical protein
MTTKVENHEVLPYTKRYVGNRALYTWKCKVCGFSETSIHAYAPAENYVPISVFKLVKCDDELVESVLDS